MNKAKQRRELEAFGERYDYDVSYMEHLLDVAPIAYEEFAGLTALSLHNQAAPRNALFAAKLVGALVEDCGPCVQLVVDMAREAGMPGDQIEAVLTRAGESMDNDTAIGFAFADAIVRRIPAEDDARDAVRAQWGDAGVIDLTLSLQIGRVFPMIKAGLGYAKSCRRVRIGDHLVDVKKEAA